MRFNQIDAALSLAVKAHTGQIDKAGQPYIFHPLRLMSKFTNENEQVVAVLHDVIEDSEKTLKDLSEIGFSNEVIDAIECLTKKTDEDYADFITRVSLNPLAKKIKIEDIKDNLDLTRLKEIEQSDLERIKKYHRALAALLR